MRAIFWSMQHEYLSARASQQGCGRQASRACANNGEVVVHLCLTHLVAAHSIVDAFALAQANGVAQMLFAAPTGLLKLGFARAGSRGSQSL